MTKRKCDLTPEQLERVRARNRLASRVENMTPEQLERRRANNSAWMAEASARKALDIEVFMLNKIDQATRVPGRKYLIPSILPPDLAAKLAPVLEMLKTADAAQRKVIRGVVWAMRAARELELAESVAQ